MKKITIFYLLLLAVMFNLSSCGDKDDVAEPSKLELLTSKTWQINKVFAGSTDISVIVQGATFKFNNDKTFTTTSSVLPSSGTWDFASDGTIIVLEPGTSNEQRWTVTELEDNSFKATITNPDDNTKYQAELVPVP